ncbi:MAG: hypothetical protein GF416_07395 [Candidatus Altiarchaeales archaeon]|nr:hypothetical protein [Candidatus Altiarchaeales archaeon]MBD3416937.1 hypothetical protein [Candidatus Altiarchaeales archaeon]
MADPVGKYVEDILWVRDRLKHMDGMCNPVMGVGDWDDAACVEFKGKLLISSDGPYAKRLVLKSALVHAATDVVVKGGRPLFALDCLIGGKPEVEEMLESLVEQADYLKLPLIGGNTLYEDVEPRCSLTVVGELLLDEPIRDSTAVKDDVIALLGEPIWGGRGERLEKAKLLFDAWYAALDKVRFNSAKDVTKGGLKAVVHEMQSKSGLKFELDDVPYPMTRNLDNFIVTLPEFEYVSLEKVCSDRVCRLTRAGRVL